MQELTDPSDYENLKKTRGKRNKKMYSDEDTPAKKNRRIDSSLDSDSIDRSPNKGQFSEDDNLPEPPETLAISTQSNKRSHLQSKFF